VRGQPPPWRRRRCSSSAAAGEGLEGHWAPKWRRLLLSAGGPNSQGSTSSSDAEPPQDFTEFDRTVRGMLNRISTENAPRLLPLDPGLRGAGGDCPPWWAARFAALMLNSYLQVIHTNRGARGLATRSPDNVLPEYLDAVGPLLAQSPRLMEALLAWLARLLHFCDMCWPTVRLLLLAAKEPRERAALPAHSLGRLPPELIRGRILGYLAPPTVPAQAASATGLNVPGAWSMEEDEKDVIAVLVHLVMFVPVKTWPRISAFAFALADLALTGAAGSGEGPVYLAASILVTIAQRLDGRIPDAAVEAARAAAGAGSDLLAQYPPRPVLMRDLRPLVSLAARLSEAVVGGSSGAGASGLSKFVYSRVKTALEMVRRVQDRLLAEPPAYPSGPDRSSPGRGRQRRCP